MSLQAYNKTSRKDGRSDGKVVFDLALKMQPNEILTFEVLLEALQEGMEKEFNKNRVYASIKSANRKLLKKHNRYLAVVRGTGYKMITADEHLAVALFKKNQAQKTMQTGLEILEHTAFEELSPAHRILHEQQMLVMRGLYQQVKYHDKKLNETESIIDKMRNEQQAMMERLEKLEGK